MQQMLPRDALNQEKVFHSPADGVDRLVAQAVAPIAKGQVSFVRRLEEAEALGFEELL